MIFIILFSDLREKEVINVRDGSRFGSVIDLIFSVETGEISHLIVPVGGKLFGLLGNNQELRIPYCDIDQIGDDLIIVNVDVTKCIHNY